MIKDEDVDLLVTELAESYGYDFSHYARTSLKRRINRLVVIDRHPSFAELLYRIKQDASYLSHVVEELTVNVTEMFRDPSFWRAVVEHVFPVWKEREFVKVWSAGCSTGEEIYTLMILLEEHGLRNKVKILGTDLNESVMHKAKKGRIGTRHYKDYQKAYQDAGGLRNCGRSRPGF